ncbi:helix-turn-helix transcriptional regulator [Heliobacterium chlorum]|uniref:Helix-turn-helix transcriptional regulator n=1 Tax=Heliobacterium chlorum TaxID=2698 RepID=A0ABR7SYV1_HELCL|nr:helix-turn-helix transcriptional regulator [Heliobacterium chlorum]MBC9783707.1 helix-turn-helix transcriptional regulator [Heliobacterium chlorum]
MTFEEESDLKCSRDLGPDETLEASPGYGRGRGRGRGRCGCGGGHGGRTDSMAFPSVLLSLRQHPAHGYELMEKLSQMPFIHVLPDAAVVYRYLRRLEEEGMVESRLEPGKGGPARKVYSITPEGECYLRAWAVSLKKQKSDLEAFLRVFEGFESAGEAE